MHAVGQLTGRRGDQAPRGAPATRLAAATAARTSRRVGLVLVPPAGDSIDLILLAVLVAELAANVAEQGMKVFAIL
jgi:hypothetical protein